MIKIKKIFVLILLIIVFNTSVYALATGPGLPTFDFSNLAQAIDSLTNAVKFYEETLNNLKFYKNRLESFGRNISNFDLNRLFNNISDIKNTFKKIRDYLVLCKKEATYLFDETEDLFKRFDNNLYSYLNINTSNLFQNSIKSLRKEIDISKISSLVGSNLKEIETKLNEIQNKKKEWIKEFEENQNRFDSLKDDAYSFIESLISSNSESIVSLLNLDIENSKVESLDNLKFITEEKKEEFIKEIETKLDLYKKNLTKLQEKTNLFINNLKEIEELKNLNKNKKLLKNN